MKENSKKKAKKKYSVRVMSLEELISCPQCGFDIELWSEELLTRCLSCGYYVFRKERIIH
jgi:DNA-directed RNA polymerase subunit RPC12/RpoP